MTTTFSKLTLLFFASLLLETTLAQELFTSAAKMKLATKKEIMYRLPNLPKEQKITVGILDGYAIFEGDIVLYKEGQQKDAGIIGDNYRWENGVIPYVIADGHPLAADIRRAIDIMNQQTNLCIRPRTNERDYLLIINGNGAYSYLGRQGGEQILSYTSGYAFGSIMHELLHAAGMYHEQCRSDRDNYVRIDFQSIETGAERNFGKYNTISSCAYDFGSIMHYSLKAFSNNGNPTIVPLVPIPTGITVGQRTTLSACDIAGIRSLYPNATGCSPTTMTLLGLKNGKLKSTSLLDNMLDNSSKVVGKGDFNGDGTQDFIVYSDKGIKIFSYVNSTWQVLVNKPNGTSFGGWIFRTNQNDDTIEGTGDFNGDGKTDIVIRSPWGLGILTYNNAGSLDLLMWQAVGGSLGGWIWNADTYIRAVSDFNGDGRADMLVTSSWGIGVLTLQGKTMSPLVSKPNGTSFGGWVFRLQKNEDSIEGTGDFNGDGKTDIVIRSPWGLGILTYNNAGTLDLLMWQAAGGSLDGWIWNADTRIKAVSDFNGDGRAEMLVTSSWGIGVLTLQGATMKLLVAKPNRTSLGGWIFKNHPNDDIIVGTGDFDGNGKKDVVIRSNWGIGILTLNAAGNSFDGLDFQANGAVLGSWALKPSDKILVLGNFDKADRQDELLIQR